MRISIIGVGRLGGALALALSKKGHSIENLVARNPAGAEKIAEKISPKPRILKTPETESLSNSEIILIAAQDSEIEKIAGDLSGILTQNKPFVFHTSGSLSSDILSSLKKIGCPVGSIHPLVSVSDSFLGADRFADVFFCVEGDAESVAVAEKLVGDLAGKAFSIETKFKTLYHAAAVTAAGHITALFGTAIEMLSACGLTDEAAQKVLLPLVKSAIANLEDQTPAQALTGTFARADILTMQRHLQTIKENVSAELLQLYVRLGLRSIRLAEMQGAADGESLAKMREFLLAEDKCAAQES